MTVFKKVNGQEVRLVMHRRRGAGKGVRFILVARLGVVLCSRLFLEIESLGNKRLSKWEIYTGGSFALLKAFLNLFAAFEREPPVDRTSPNGLC